MAIQTFCGFEHGPQAGYNEGVTWQAYISDYKRLPGELRSYPRPDYTNGGQQFLSGCTSDGRCVNNWSLATVYISFFFLLKQWDCATSGEEDFVVVYYWNTGLYTQTPKLYVRIDSSRYIKVYNSAGTLIQTFTTQLSLYTWYRLDVKCGTGTSGAWEVRLDITTETHSGTSNLTTNNTSTFEIGAVYPAGTSTIKQRLDDMIMKDDAYAGTYSIYGVSPTAEGYYKDEVTGDPDTAPDTWKNVDDYAKGADGLGSGILYHSYSQKRATYSHAGLPNGTTGNVLGVMAGGEPVFSGGSGHANKWRVRIRSGSTDGDGTDEDWSDSQYNTSRKFARLWTTNPATSAAFTISEVNSLQFGFMATPIATDVGYTNYLWMEVLLDAVLPIPPLALCNMFRRVA